MDIWLHTQAGIKSMAVKGALGAKDKLTRYEDYNIPQQYANNVHILWDVLW